METTNISILLLSGILLLNGCSNKKEYNNSTNDRESISYSEINDYKITEEAPSEAKESTDFTNSIPKEIIRSEAANIQHKSKKFIYTANIDFKVNNVFNSTINIEKSAVKHDGFIIKSNLRSRIISDIVTPISKDSAEQIKVYTFVNEIITRVPQKQLYDFLMNLNSEIEFLNYRNIEAEDISINLESIKLNQIQVAKNQKRLEETLNQKGKLKEKTDLIDNINYNEIAKNESIIKEKIINDKVEYSTISITLNENSRIQKTKIINTENFRITNDYNFDYKSKVAIIKGIKIFQNIIIFLLYLWPFLLILIMLFITLKFYKKKKPSK